VPDEKNACAADLACLRDDPKSAASGRCALDVTVEAVLGKPADYRNRLLGFRRSITGIGANVCEPIPNGKCRADICLMDRPTHDWRQKLYLTSTTVKLRCRSRLSVPGQRCGVPLGRTFHVIGRLRAPRFKGERMQTLAVESMVEAPEP
jgi:hypothetical protein